MTAIRQRDQSIAAVRGFNRFYTRQIGVLRKTFLDSPYSLGEARVLYELASGRAATASQIGRALDLDAGYLSRVLRNFEKRGLIRRKVSARDARQSHLTLTARGHAAYAPLDESLSRVVLDLGKRPYLSYNLPLRGRIGSLESETLEEWWRAFSVHLGATMHVDLLRGKNRHHMAESAFKALGLALRQAMAVGEGGVPSSKGLLG